MAPVLCKSLKDRASLLGLGWTITSVFSFLALLTAAIMSAMSHSYYMKMASSASEGYGGNNNDNNKEGDPNNNVDPELYKALASVGSFSVIFAGLYTMILAGALSCFGGLCVVGFVAPNGKYIKPFWTGTGSSSVSSKNLGIFLGSLVLFSNLCLVIAVVLGEFQVGNYFGERQKEEELGYFAIEQTATLIGTMSMFLSVLYALYSVLLFASKEVILESDKDEIIAGGIGGSRSSSIGYMAPLGALA